MTLTARTLLLAVSSILVSRSALGHALVGVEGFAGGALHPLLVPAHSLTLVALGVMAGGQGWAGGLRLLAVFTLSLGAGVAMVVAAYAPQDPGLILLICAVAAGLVAALGRPLPFAIAATISGVAAIALLLDSVPPAISAWETLQALAGTILSACGVLGLVTCLAMSAARDWQRIAVRIAGSWCAASALLVLALTLSR